MKRQIQRWLALCLAMLFLFSSVRAEGVRILFIGDSITDGNWGGGGAKPSHKRALWDMNHIFGHGFMSLCASHYMSRYPERDYQFFNRGISGHGLYDLEKRWQTDVLDLQPDVLSILIGTNDVHHYLHGDKSEAFDLHAWEQTYRRLLDEARAQNPNLQFVLAAPFIEKVGKIGEQGDYPERARLIAQLDTLVESIARDYHAIYLPYQELFAQLLQNTSTQPASYWIWDGIHPTAAAHQRMADLWIKAVDPYLTRLAGTPAQQ